MLIASLSMQRRSSQIRARGLRRPVWEENQLLKRGKGVKMVRGAVRFRHTRTQTHRNTHTQLTELSIVTARWNAMLPVTNINIQVLPLAPLMCVSVTHTFITS